MSPETFSIRRVEPAVMVALKCSVRFATEAVSSAREKAAASMRRIPRASRTHSPSQSGRSLRESHPRDRVSSFITERDAPKAVRLRKSELHRLQSRGGLGAHEAVLGRIEGFARRDSMVRASGDSLAA